MIAGVCQGLGAYLGFDANIIRIAFVVLTFITSGFWILIYLAMAMFLPVAKSDAELSEAYGKPVTAQDIVDRVKERAPTAEAMERTTTLLKQIAKVALKVIGGISVAVFTLLTFGYVFALWMVCFGRLQFQGQLAFMNGWLEVLAFTIIYALLAIPAFLIYKGFTDKADGKKPTGVARGSEFVLIGLWLAAAAGFVVFCSAYASAFQSYANAHGGYIDVGGGSYCVDNSMCDPGNPRYHFDTRVR
jgi:phage shock protein PspC (stress-responsive transcriptional regulator)